MFHVKHSYSPTTAFLASWRVTSQTHCRFLLLLSFRNNSMQVCRLDTPRNHLFSSDSTNSMQVFASFHGVVSLNRRISRCFRACLRTARDTLLFEASTAGWKSNTPSSSGGGGLFYLPISDGVRFTSSCDTIDMPNAIGRFSCPHSGSISNGDFHLSSSLG